jgi:hypothetical protein
MATPATSGSLTLIRQYYTEGWYPTGTKTGVDAFAPTGALLKATIVNSAVKMSKFTWANGTAITLGDPPGTTYRGSLGECLPVFFTTHTLLR